CGEFADNIHPGIGPNLELRLRPDTTPSGLLNILLNGRCLLELMQRIIGCGRIGCFLGRVYRLVPGKGHPDAGHTDTGGSRTRLAALSLNLSPKPYAGGFLQFRDAAEKTLLGEVANTGFGDAVLFQLAPCLQHRVSEVEGPMPKTAFAGWYYPEPD